MPRPQLSQEVIKNRFEEIKKLVNLGYPRYIACKKLKIQRKFIYKYLNSEQLRELDEIYFQYSNGYNNKYRILEKQNKKNSQI
jgi:hypothetical protein